MIHKYAPRGNIILLAHFFTGSLPLKGYNTFNLGAMFMKVYYVNKRWLFFIWIILGLIIIAFYIIKIRDNKAYPTFASPIHGTTIVIDAGHGGIDPGAVSKNGTCEDEINLKIAKKLQVYIEKEGAKAVMTRKTDKGLYEEDFTGSRKRQDMQRRVEIIKEANPDLVISIHLNQFGQSQYFGAQTFYKANSEESEVLAKSIQEQLIRVLDKDNKREIKPSDDFMILKAVDSPSVLVECGFLSNPQEEHLLKTDDYQERIAWAIYCGIISYLSKA